MIVKKTAPQVVIGIDPGYDRLGWAIVKSTSGAQWTLIDCGCIQTSKTMSRFDRYKQLENHLSQVLAHFKPSKAGIEQLFSARNTTTVIPVAEARGIILSCLFRQNVEIVELNPGTIKSAVTGNGRADKVAMRKMIMMQLTNISPELRQKVDHSIDDTVDAIGAAVTAVFQYPS